MNSSANNSHSESFFQRMQRGMEWGAFDNRVGQRVLRAWEFGIQDPVVRRLAEDMLRPFEKKQVRGEMPPFKAARLSSGNLLLGKDFFGKLDFIDPQWLTAGLLLLSNTGGGKSNLLCFLLLQLALRGCVLWISDTYKRQLRRLRRKFRLLGVDLVIMRPQDWRWNLLQSHLRDARTHLTMVVDLLMRVLDLPPRARTILIQGCHELYRRFGIWEGRNDAWPTLFDLYEFLRLTPNLNAAARDAILDRLGSLCVSLTPRCAAYRVGWDPAQLAQYSIDFEMAGTSEAAKELFLGSLLSAVFYHEVERGIVNGSLKLAIAFDDSQKIFGTGENSGSPEIAPLDELAGIVRGCGISLWVLAQSFVGLSHRLLPNLATKIIGRLGSGEDYAHAASDLGLTAEQIAWTKLHLLPGTFVAQVSESAWREPFLFSVPLLDLSEPVTDEEAAQSVQPLQELPTFFAEEFAHWEPRHIVEVSSRDTPTEPTLSEIELRYLRVIVATPGQTASAYAKSAGLNGKRASEIRQRLVQDGYLREHPLATSARGRSAIVVEPLPPAYQALHQTKTEAAQ